MSDYFGALMRSSGLAATGAPPGYAARDAMPAAMEETVAETSVPAHGAAAASAATPTSSSTRNAAAAAAVAGTPPAPSDTTSPAATAAAPAAASIQRVQAAAVAATLPSARTALPYAAAAPTAAPGAHYETHADAARATDFPPTNALRAPSPDTVPAQADASSRPPETDGASRVRAALQWIAADPHGADPIDRAAPFAPHRGSALPVTPIESALDETAPATRLPLVARERDDAPPVRSNAIEAWLHEPAVPLHASRREREPDDAAGDLVEVSIGAIHLRIDAPVAQPRLTTAATATAAPRPTNRAAPRDAVVRRLLRRI